MITEKDVVITSERNLMTDYIMVYATVKIQEVVKIDRSEIMGMIDNKELHKAAAMRLSQRVIDKIYGDIRKELQIAKQRHGETVKHSGRFAERESIFGGLDRLLAPPDKKG